MPIDFESLGEPRLLDDEALITKALKDETPILEFSPPIQLLGSIWIRKLLLDRVTIQPLGRSIHLGWSTYCGFLDGRTTHSPIQTSMMGCALKAELLFVISCFRDRIVLRRRLDRTGSVLPEPVSWLPVAKNPGSSVRDCQRFHVKQTLKYSANMLCYNTLDKTERAATRRPPALHYSCYYY